MAPFCKEVCFRAFGTIILAVKTRSSTLTANNESAVSLYWLKSDSSYHADLVGRSKPLPTFEKVCKESIDNVLEIEIAWKYFDQVQCDQMMEFKVAQFFPILPKK